MKSKPYRKPVFSGKDIPVIGLDQGKGRMYHGLGSHYCFNVFYDAAMLSREGQDKSTAYGSTVLNGGVEDVSKFVGEGTNIWVEGL